MKKKIGVILHPKELQWIVYRHVFAHAYMLCIYAGAAIPGGGGTGGGWHVPPSIFLGGGGIVPPGKFEKVQTKLYSIY